MGRLIGALLLLGALSWADPVVKAGFESGDLAGWNDVGDTTSLVVPSLDGVSGPVILPTEGSYFGVVGSGPGDIGLDDVPDTGVLERSFVILDPATLYFDWNFLTSEFTGDPTSPFLDTFQVVLTRAGGPTFVLISGDVGGMVTFLTNQGLLHTMLGFSVIDDLGIEAPDGSVYLEQTGWNSYWFSVGAGSYTLSFRVGDELDGSVDSALLVDNVTVPEPVGLALFSALAVAGIAARRRRR